MPRLKHLIVLGTGGLLLCCSFFLYLTLETSAPAKALSAPPPSPHPAYFTAIEDHAIPYDDPEGIKKAAAKAAGDSGCSPAAEPPAVREAVIAFVGDIMVHRPQFLQAFDAANKKYDFSPSFEYITPYLQASNLAVGNLETTLGGAERGFSGYPLFNSPDELAAALFEAGFDLICTANNHSLDSGEQGVYRTLEVLEAAGLRPFGTARSPEERDTPLLVEVNGITLAFLAFTYGTNGIPLPRGREYIVNLIHKELIRSLLEKSRKAGAELIVVYMHWGLEYQKAAGKEQKELARWLAAAGADIIIGSHPHVLQEMEFLEVEIAAETEMETETETETETATEAKNSATRRAFVAYSLGNFLSNQQYLPGAVPTSEVEYGLLLRLHLTKEGDGKASLQEVDYLLTWVDRARRHRIIPLPPLAEDSPRPPLLPEQKWPEIRETSLRLQERLLPFRPGGYNLPLQ